MYICKHCGSVFSTPTWTRSGKSICPECNSKSFSEATYCKTCHTYFISDDYTDYCPECTERAEEQLREAILQKVDGDYIKLLRSVYFDLDCIMSGGQDIPHDHA